MSHPYDALCGCNECEIAGHALDNIADSESWTAEDDAAAKAAADYDAHINELQEAHDLQLDGQDRERAERYEEDV